MRLFDEIAQIKHSPGLMYLKRPFLVTLALAAVLAWNAGAQTNTNTNTSTNIYNNLADETGTNNPTGLPRAERILSLSECLQLALRSNLDIQIQRYNPLISEYTLDGTYSAYDPIFGFTAKKSFNSSPGSVNVNTNLNFGTSTTDTENYTASLQGTLPTGLTYALDGPLTKTSQSSGTTNPIPTTWVASPGITLDQPLLKNFWIDNTRLQIRINKANLKISVEALRQQVITSITAVKTAYYNLIYARENVQVNRTALQLAQQLASENKQRVTIGTLAPLDERQAESQAAASQAALLQSQQALVVQENVLKSLLSASYQEWMDVAPVPSEELSVTPLLRDRQESWRRAFAERPDLVQERLTLEKQNVTLKYSYNQLWPQLDVTGSYGRAALSTSLDTTLNNVAAGRNEFWSVGGLLTYPLGNVAARANYKSSKATVQQVLLQLKQLEQNVAITVDNDVGQVRSTLQQVEATHAARLYAEDALDAERKKLENGKSTSFQVLQLISNLTAARLAEIRAKADYNIAQAQLDLDEGSTIEQNRIDYRVK
jgi:outer membrane protein